MGRGQCEWGAPEWEGFPMEGSAAGERLLLSSVCFYMAQPRFTATSAPLLPPSRAPSEFTTCPVICELSVGKKIRPS